MSEAIHIKGEEQFKTEVLDYKGVVVIDFRAEWCGPCRMVGPVMETLAGNYEGKPVKITKVNVDENPELSGTFQVSAIPAVFFMKDGENAGVIVGANPPTVYSEKIDELLK